MKERSVDTWQVNDEGVIALGVDGKLHTLTQQAKKGSQTPVSDTEPRCIGSDRGGSGGVV